MASKDERYKRPSYPRVYLTDLRRGMNMSAEEASRRLGVVKSYYYYIESGSRGYNLNPSLLDKIRKLYQIDANVLLDLEVRYLDERKSYIEFIENKKAR